MAIFFGKFSGNYPEQISQGYYQTIRPEMFGDLQEGDYVYAIGMRKIGFWRAKKWTQDEDTKRMDFEVILEHIGMNTNRFTSLKCFQLTVGFIIYTMRQGKRAFYRLNLNEGYNESDLSSLDFYKNLENYRKITLFETIDEAKSDDSDNIRLFRKKGDLQLIEPENSDENVFSSFRDNTDQYGKGRKQKDTTLKRFIDIELPKEYSPREVSIRSFYDAFCVEYDKYQKDVEGEETIPPSNVIDGFPDLNTILYGPPGTGKTYTSVDLAVKIADKNNYIEGDHTNNKKYFDKLIEDDQIVFTTFHQSLSYEEFVEGIKPEIIDGAINYDIQDGLFKKLCSRARIIKSNTENFDWSGRRFFKMSLGGKKEPEIHSYCLKEGRISLGWGGHTDLGTFKNPDSWVAYRDEFKERFPNLVQDSPFHIQATWKFLDMKKGDIVVATKGNHILDAIGVIEGDYKFENNNPIGYPHERNVKWLVKDLNASPEKYLRKQISQQAIYEFYNDDIRLEAFEELTNQVEQEEAKNYVLIIDEINRGNVSQIFGELITLLEPDKREGKDNSESITVTLPYSKTKFSVPSNLYVIGTMNTADRSVEALDAALRRRFKFIQISPQSDMEELNYEIEDIHFQNLLNLINERISYLKDKDHQIGHSYFLSIEDSDDLKSVFEKNIIPLLNEYFYNDLGKIRMILGDGFVKKLNVPKFAVNDDELALFDKYQLVRFDDEFDIISALQQTLKGE